MLRLRHLTIAGAVIASTLALTLVASGGASGASLPNTKVIPGACALDLRADHSHCNLSLIATLKGEPKAAAAPTAGYGPADLRSAYALPSSGGAGQTVAIVDAFGDTTAEADMNAYRSNYGLPACTTANGCFKKVNQNGVQGSYPANNQGWALETQLDLEMVSATCPGCKILLVEATSNINANLYAAEDTAARLGATAISNSYGGAEASSETADDAHFNHPGAAITVSSGDSGFGVEYPAASRYVTAVGGTTLSHGSNARGWTETAWSGSGSGCSAYEPKPAWQTDSGCARRTVADVSAVADPNTGVAVYDSNCNFIGQLTGQCFSGWGVVGGTSASSPIVAGVYALAGNGSSVNYGSFPYSHTSSLFDVTSGNNGSCSPAYLCTSGAGYDGPTGLGTPNGTAAF
jgi:subtilase family serine protease